MQLIYFFLLVFFFSSCNFFYKKNDGIEKIELGKQLFFERQLSLNNTKSCASCHDPRFAFTDGYKKSIGIYGDVLQRNSKALFNLQNQKYFTAADSTIYSLLQQMNNPLFNQHPPELGLYGKEKEIVLRFLNNKKYELLFSKAFGKQKSPINFTNIKIAIASFVNSITSYNSKYDKYINGDITILNKDEKLGMQLFFSTKTNCSSCHNGSNFDEPILLDENKNKDFYFNTGIYNIDAYGSYPTSDIGLKQLTKVPTDMGKYRVPTLRNLIYTSPYYHDGSEANLMTVINNYNDGGRNISIGVNKGNGALNPFKNNLIKQLYLTEIEKKQLLSFLYTLTDSSLIKNEKYILTNNINSY